MHAAAPSDTFEQMSLQQTCIETAHRPRTEPPVPPGPGAAREAVLDYIKQQLDCFGTEPLLMNRFQLLGPCHRATGGALLSYCLQAEHAWSVLGAGLMSGQTSPPTNSNILVRSSQKCYA